MNKKILLSVIFFCTAFACFALQDGYYRIGQGLKLDKDLLLQSSSEKQFQPVFYFSQQYKSRRIVKGQVFNPDPVMQTVLKVILQDFYCQVKLINQLTDYNNKNGNDIKPSFVQTTFGMCHTFYSVPEWLRSVKLDFGYTTTHVSKDIKRDQVLQAKNQMFIDIATTTYFNPGIKVMYDTQYQYFCFDFYTVNVYSLSRVPYLSRFRLKNTSNIYYITSKFNKLQYGIDRNMATAAHNQLYLQYSYSRNLSFGPTFQITRALDSSVKTQWKNSRRNNSSNILFGFKVQGKF